VQPKPCRQFASWDRCRVQECSANRDRSHSRVTSPRMTELPFQCNRRKGSAKGTSGGLDYPTSRRTPKFSQRRRIFHISDYVVNKLPLVIAGLAFRASQWRRQPRPWAKCLSWVSGRKSHSEQIWSALPPIADIDFSRVDFSVGPLPDSCSAARDRVIIFETEEQRWQCEHLESLAADIAPSRDLFRRHAASLGADDRPDV
jgi:hypothetical protein